VKVLDSWVHFITRVSCTFHRLLKRPMTADGMHRVVGYLVDDLKYLEQVNIDYFSKNSFIDGQTYHDHLKKELRGNFDLVASNKFWIEQKKNSFECHLSMLRILSLGKLH
jgi:hypothetical protein